MTAHPRDLDPPLRVLLGPGPSNVHPRVTRALGANVVGYLDPAWFATMAETVELLRTVYGTTNRLTIPLSGTGMSGMEGLFFNLLEPDDTIIIGVSGFFGDRMLEVAARAGANVVPIHTEWGTPFDPAQIADALAAAPDAKAVAIVHAETSTGVLQPVDEIGRIVRDHGALFILDCVTSLGGIAVNADARAVDAAYSCTQKNLGAPPGLSPITVSDRAWARIMARERPCQSWYLDLKLLEDYWLGSHAYHHTPPAAMIYALREALRVAVEEGLDARYQRHARNGAALQAGLEAMGLTLAAKAGYRLPTLTTVRIPDGADDARVRTRLRELYGIEIGGGLGPFRGRVWRIGLMGAASSAANVTLALTTLADTLAAEGVRVDGAAGVAAATAMLTAAAVA